MWNHIRLMCYGKIWIVGSPVLYQALQIILYSSFIKLGCERFRLEARSHLLTEFQCKAIKHRCFIYLKNHLTQSCKILQNYMCFYKKIVDYNRRNVTLLSMETYSYYSPFPKMANVWVSWRTLFNTTIHSLRFDFIFLWYLYFSTYISLRTSR